MATSKGFQRSSPHKDRLYDFCIKFLRITGISLPIRSESVGSSSINRQRYCLKITLLHGTEQQKIGEFEVVGDECIINHQLSCETAYGASDKLHVYIDQNWSAGLSGHITVDLKEFFEDVNVEIYLEYPLFSSGPSHVQRTSKLEMSVLCAFSKKTTEFLNHVDSSQEFLGFEDLRKLRTSLDDFWYPPDLLDAERSHEASSILIDSVLKEMLTDLVHSANMMNSLKRSVVTPANGCFDKIDREIEMLKEMEGDLIELNSKLHRYVAAQSLENFAPGQRTSNISTRPDVLAAVFFAAGMAFQRQVDNVNRLRMHRRAEDPFFLGENSNLLLEDVSPSSRSAASRNPEVDSFCQSSDRSLVLSESSSNSCGHGQSCSEAATSLAGDIDEDENDRNYLDSLCLGDPDIPMSHLESESESSRTSNNTSSSFGESSTSNEVINLVKNETPSQPNSRLGKHNVLNVVGSVFSAFTMAELSSSSSKNTGTRSGGSKDDEVTVAGTMLGRQEVTSIQTIRKSNPGLGWLSNSIQFK